MTETLLKWLDGLDLETTDGNAAHMEPTRGDTLVMSAIRSLFFHPILNSL